MIERFYLKDYLSFKEIELNLNNGLVVFTGPSGSGKSILMNAILSSFGKSSCEASICESSTTWELKDNKLYDDINVFRHIKKEKSRYFINNKSLSKKDISDIAINYLKHLSLKDFSDFENTNLISIIDERIKINNPQITEIKNNYISVYKEFHSVKNELDKLLEEEKKIKELKEFIKYEIKKIEDVNPKINEDEELLEIKKELSKKEKILEKISSVTNIFEYEQNVSNILESLDTNSSFFDDAMNELRAILDNAQEKFEALDDIDIESVLNRIEELSDLKRRYGTIEDALIYKEDKIKELHKYENIEITKGNLEQRYKNLNENLISLATKLSSMRNMETDSFSIDLNRYLKELYLRDATVTIIDKEYSLDGKDEILLQLNNTQLNKISTGEFNRLRLAILALKSKFMNKNGGVLMLDEIDANLSGEESMSVAKVLRQLSKHFQIFVISHQPQLTSMGDQHFLIHKNGDESFVDELDFDARINEIARIISGDKISNEAKKFAKDLLKVASHDY